MKDHADKMVDPQAYKQGIVKIGLLPEEKKKKSCGVFKKNLLCSCYMALTYFSTHLSRVAFTHYRKNSSSPSVWAPHGSPFPAQ